MRAHQDQNTLVRDQFGKQAAAYARLVRSRNDESYVRLMDVLRPTAADHALDVGCGTGLFSLSLAGSAGHVTGIDLTPQMLEQARALQEELKIANVQWKQGDALPLPFPDGAFSIVVTKATFHHMADPAAILAEMARVCRSGGRISVTDLTPAPDKLESFDSIERLRDPSHVHTLTTQQLRSLGQMPSLRELDFWPSQAVLPLEAVLATSFPEPGDLLRVRELYQDDAASGADRFGLSTREENGQLIVTYPMTTVVWEKR